MIDLSNSFIFPKGDKVEGENFKGEAWQERLVPMQSEWNCPIGNVTFAPGARNSWHSHPGGQILLITAGRGWYQEEGKPAQEILPGTVIHIPANVKHWHGAATDSWFSHLAFELPGENNSTEWLEPVTDNEYNNLK